MNAFNRVIMAAAALALLALSILAFLVLTGAISPPLFGGDCVLDDVMRRLAVVRGSGRVVGTAVAGLMALGAIALFYLELRPPRRRSRLFLISSTELGQLTVEPEGVSKLAERTAVEIEQVSACRTLVSEGESGVVCQCNVTVTSDAHLGDIGDEVQKRVRDVIEGRIGLKVELVSVRTRIGSAPTEPPARTLE